MKEKTIKIKFIGFWSGLNADDNFITNTLKQKYNVIICDDADYAFVSVFDYSFDSFNFPGVRIFYSGENVPPDFASFDYGISFDRMTYGDRYLRYPIGLMYASNMETRNSRIPDKNQVKSKPFFAVFMYRHEGIPYRTALFEKLSEYKCVTSTGTYLHNCDIDIPDVPDRSEQVAFESKAKFVIACENTSFPGYVTEKLDLALAAGTIPIYYGDPTVCEDFNPDAFINCMEYDSIDDVIERVKEIDQDDDLYLKMVNAQPYRESDYIQKKQKELGAFLFNIFDQPYEKAFRRPMQEEANHCRAKEQMIAECKKQYESVVIERNNIQKKYNKTLIGLVKRKIKKVYRLFKP